MARKIKFARFSGCFWCGLPQSICSRWEQRAEGGRWQISGEECQYAGVLLEGLIGIVLGFQSQVGDKYVDRMRSQGCEIGQQDWWTQYLGKKVEVGEVESNKLVWEFLWVARQVD